MKTIIIENNWLPGIMNHGWGNGYVVIPIGHPLNGKDHNDISVDVHGGLTFSEEVDDSMMEAGHWAAHLTTEDKGAWIIGFDTTHYSDTQANWPKERVQEETNRLAEQIAKATNQTQP